MRTRPRSPPWTARPPHVPEGEITLGSLIAFGASGGLVPCPSALVLLLSAIALGRVALGLLLLVGFSLGLAAVLMGIGMLVLYAKNLLPDSKRTVAECRLPGDSRLVGSGDRVPGSADDRRVAGRHPSQPVHRIEISPDSRGLRCCLPGKPQHQVHQRLAVQTLPSLHPT